MNRPCLSAEKIAIADRLRKAVQLSGMTVKEVGKKLGWHKPAIGDMVACRRSIKAEEVKALCAVLHVSVVWFMGLTNDS